MHQPTQNSLIRMLRLGTAVLVPTGLALLSFPPSTKAAWNPFEICSLELIEENINAEEAALACAEAIEPEDLSLCVLKINGLTSVDAKSALRACFRDRRPLEMAECVVDITQEVEEQQFSSRLRLDAELIESRVDRNAEANIVVESELINAVDIENVEIVPGTGIGTTDSIPIQTVESITIKTDTVETHSQKTLDHCRRSLLPRRFSECVIGLRRSANLPTDRALRTCIEAEGFPRNLFPRVDN